MKAIQEYLKLTGMSQAALAKRAKISPTSMSHFMSGRREPRIKNLRKLSDATGLSIDKLVEGFK